VFLIACLGVLCTVYWTCAVLAQLLLTSPQERALPAAARAGVGLLWLLTVFAAGWQLFSPGLTWLAVLALLALWLWRDLARLASPAWWRELASDHWRTFVACVAIALIFFSPLAVKQRFGPFTEGGGDVSIYADTSLYLGNLGWSARGTPASTPRDFAANFRDTIDTTIDYNLSVMRALARYEKADRAPMNPPAAENAIYRAVVLRSFSPFLYVPYVAFDFLRGDTNYHVYYGFQALVYALLIACGWATFRRYGRGACVAYAALLLASHSLISVPYNTYSAQTLALFSCVLMLCLAFNGIRAWTLAGLRTIVIPFLFIWVSYAHYFSILVPLAALAFLVPREDGFAAPRGARLSPAAWVSLAGFGFLMALLLWGGSDYSIRFIRDLVLHRLEGKQNVFMGEHIAAFSWRWLEWLFGFVSQQHVPPLAHEIVRVNHVITAGISAAAVLIVSSAVLAAWRVADSRARGAPFPRDVAILVLLGGTAALHVYSAQAYIYTQAKGAQNVIPVLYAWFVVAAVMAWTALPGPRAIRAAGLVALASVALFAVALAAPRAGFAWKLAMTLDRGTILEPSFFDEARRITSSDSRAFALFEPRKSADLYMSNEPFFGSRMIPTRHLALTRMRFDRSPPEPQRMNGADFIDEGDVAHLWMLGAERKGGRDVWQAIDLAASKEPTLHLFADNYEQDQGIRIRAGTGDKARFSWLRNGAALVFLPPGRPYAVEATLLPTDAAHLPAMREDVSKRIAAGELAGARMEARGDSVALVYEGPAIDRPRMLRVAHYGGEYWLNVRAGASDLPKSPFGVAEPVKLVVAVAPVRDGERPVRVSWTAEESDSQDWIGVFPEGGADASRIAFKFTGGRATGTIELVLPAASRGAFEIRFFRAGTWNAAEAVRVVLDAPTN
jgi:hypothetical protein